MLVRDRSRLGHKPDYRLRWSSEYVRKSMYACRSVSVACRPAEKRRRCGEIGSIHRSILVGHRRLIGLKGLSCSGTNLLPQMDIGLGKTCAVIKPHRILEPTRNSNPGGQIQSEVDTTRLLLVICKESTRSEQRKVNQKIL